MHRIFMVLVCQHSVAHVSLYPRSWGLHSHTNVHVRCPVARLTMSCQKGSIVTHKPLQSNAGPAAARHLPAHDDNLTAREQGCLPKEKLLGSYGQLLSISIHLTFLWLVTKPVQCYSIYDALYTAGYLLLLPLKLVLTSSISSAGTPGTLYRPQHHCNQQRTQRVPEAT